MRRPFCIEETVAPVKLPKETGALPEEGNITGWGNVVPEISSLAPDLRITKVKIFDDDTCKSLYPDGAITERMLCAGYLDGHTDACQVDASYN